MQMLVLVLLITMTVPGNHQKDHKSESSSIEFRLAEAMPGKRLTEATVAGTEQKVYLHTRVELSRKDIAHAMVRLDDAQGRPSIHLSFNEEGAARMETLSKANQGKMLAIVVGGKVLSAPTIQTTLKSSALITGSLTLKEAEKIVAAINQKKEP